jgi:hypothetical protein
MRLLVYIVACFSFVRPLQTQAVDHFEQNRRLGRGVNIIGYDPLWNNRDQAR